MKTSIQTKITKIKYLFFLHRQRLKWIISYYLAFFHKYKKNNSYGSELNIIVLHDNPLTTVGGVELASLEMIEWLQNNHPEHNLYVYFYSQNKKRYELLFFKDNKLMNIILNENLIEEIISKKMQITIFEHVKDHKLSKIKKLLNNSRLAYLFIHDYYYLSLTADLLNQSELTDLAEIKISPENKLMDLFFDSHTKNLTRIFNSNFTLQIYKNHWKNYSFADAQISSPISINFLKGLR